MAWLLLFGMAAVAIAALFLVFEQPLKRAYQTRADQRWERRNGSDTKQ